MLSPQIQYEIRNIGLGYIMVVVDIFLLGKTKIGLYIEEK